MIESQLREHYADVRRRLMGAGKPRKPSSLAEVAAQKYWREKESPAPAPIITGSFGDHAWQAGKWTARFHVNQRDITISRIIDLICEAKGISKIEMISARRLRAVVRPRHIVMYLCRELTTRSFPEIGRRLGGRDHTTIMHGCRKVARLITVDDELREEIEAYKRALLQWQQGEAAS